MKVIRHAGDDSRMIILDNQAHQQMTRQFQLSLQCNISPITGFVRHTAKVKLVIVCEQACVDEKHYTCGKKSGIIL